MVNNWNNNIYIPSGKHTKKKRKITMLLMGKSTISMAIFHSYVKLPEGIYLVGGVEHVL